MKKTLFAIFMVAATCQMVHAQSMGSDYKTAVGIKFYPGGLTVKSFIKPNVALEGLGYFYADGLGLQAYTNLLMILAVWTV